MLFHNEAQPCSCGDPVRFDNLISIGPFCNFSRARCSSIAVKSDGYWNWAADSESVPPISMTEMTKRDHYQDPIHATRGRGTLSSELARTI